MSRIWFGRGVSNHAQLLPWIRSHEASQNWQLLVSHYDRNAACLDEADEYWLEDKELYGDAYVDYALQSCLNHQVSVFIPGREFIALSKRVKEFKAMGVKILLSASTQTLTTIENKNEFYSQIAHSPLPGPAFREFGSLKELDESYEAMKGSFGRLCVKPAVGIFAAGFRVIVEKIDAFENFFEPHPFRIELEQLRSILAHRESFATMLLMEFLEGDEYSVDCFGSQSQELYMTPRCKRHGHQLLAAPQEVLDGVRWLAQHFDMKGLFNVQLKYQKGIVRTIEINPRMSGGIAMTRYAGFNFPVAAIAEALGEPITLINPTLGAQIIRRENYTLRQKKVL
ncbi:MAG: ATP-grasp domain-containing protein [Campylobacterales bacterium]|nr:ATP-grasp domain-containing protein [Campylobacterales bacterium]